MKHIALMASNCVFFGCDCKDDGPSRMHSFSLLIQDAAPGACLFEYPTGVTFCWDGTTCAGSIADCCTGHGGTAVCPRTMFDYLLSVSLTERCNATTCSSTGNDTCCGSQGPVRELSHRSIYQNPQDLCSANGGSRTCRKI